MSDQYQMSESARTRSEADPRNPRVDAALFDALTLWAQRSSVFLASDWLPHGPANGAGTGFVLRTPGGLPVILTAKHNLEGSAPATMHAAWLDFRRSKDVVADYAVHPGKPDVGIIVPRPELRTEFLALAVGMENLDPSYEVGPDDAFAIAGYPAELVETRPDGQKVTAVVYGCQPLEPARDERGRLRFPWAGPDLPMAPLFKGPVAAAGPKSPVGMSGGACWAFKPIPVHQPWFPQSAVLAGIQSMWLEGSRVMFVEPIANWYDWLITVVEKIDG